MVVHVERPSEPQTLPKPRYDVGGVLLDRPFRIRRLGRDTPASNWHTDPADPDGHTNELYYGIEQVGWEGYSKPRAMYNRGFGERPPLPQIAEFDEIQDAIAAGIDLESGVRHIEKN